MNSLITCVSVRWANCLSSSYRINPGLLQDNLMSPKLFQVGLNFDDLGHVGLKKVTWDVKYLINFSKPYMHADDIILNYVSC